MFSRTWGILHVVHHIVGTFEQDEKCMCKRKNEARSCNHGCHRETISIQDYKCMSVALVIRHAKRMFHIIV